MPPSLWKWTCLDSTTPRGVVKVREFFCERQVDGLGFRANELSGMSGPEGVWRLFSEGCFRKSLFARTFLGPLIFFLFFNGISGESPGTEKRERDSSGFDPTVENTRFARLRSFLRPATFLATPRLRDLQGSGGSLLCPSGSVFFMNSLNISSGKGKTMVEVLSLAIWLNV